MESTFRDWYKKKMLATHELVADAQRIDKLLDEVKTIAVVGVSSNKTRDSHFVARYLKKAGYHIIPVNPTADRILREKSYPDLNSIPEKVDVVDVFRRPDQVEPIVRQAFELKPKVIWLQLGTGTHNDLKKEADERGILLFQNRCIKTDHQFLKRPEQG